MTKVLKYLSLPLVSLLLMTFNACTIDNKYFNTEPEGSLDSPLLETKDQAYNASTSKSNKDSESTAAKPSEEPTSEKPQDGTKQNKNSSGEVQTVFKQGDTGDKIKEIQRKLNKFGYNLSVDGIFGASTYYAVIDFQNRHKIEADGIVGPQTLAKLEEPPTPETMYKPEKPQSTGYTGPVSASDQEKFVNSNGFSSSTAYFIWIDLPHQHVYIFNGSKSSWKLIKSFICSSGKPSTPTVKGYFTVGNKGSYFIADGGAMCKYYTQISGNYLFHSVLFDRQGKNIIDYTLGVPVSHGCVRLAPENAKYIYDNIPRGTTIWSN